MSIAINLTIIWAFIIAFAVFVYVVMDGFDLGLGLLFPLFLIAATIWTYNGATGASNRRVYAVISLRLFAYLLALLALARPALGLVDHAAAQGVLFVLVDKSASMSIADEADNGGHGDSFG